MITIFIATALMEAFSALFLFRYFAAIDYFLYPSGFSTAFLIKKATRRLHTVVSSEPSPLFIPDKELGYTTIPGRYRVRFALDGESLLFTLTVSKPGIRATAYTKHLQGRSMYVFGDSFILGWGNNDEHSVPWLLQQKFPSYDVVNLAQAGYGITHAVIQHKAMSSKMRLDDIVILPYAEFYLVRNFGAPSWMNILSRGLERNLGRKEAFLNAAYPVARSARDGTLLIEHIKHCERNREYCERSDPPQSEMIDATKAIIDYFAKVDARVVFAYVEGRDNSPVVKHARDQGLAVVDIRLRRRTPEWDNFEPFDSHPGPRAQYNFFDKLANALVQKGVIAPLNPKVVCCAESN